jgi:hypothetical protein
MNKSRYSIAAKNNLIGGQGRGKIEVAVFGVDELNEEAHHPESACSCCYASLWPMRRRTMGSAVSIGCKAIAAISSCFLLNWDPAAQQGNW